MSESTKSVQSGDAWTTPRAYPDGVLDGVPADAPGQTSPSVRELLAELARLEDATRGLGGVRRPRWTAQTPDILAALAREQEIIDELRRRCPDADPATASAADQNGAAAQAD
jgi:hypothetical protein